MSTRSNTLASTPVSELVLKKHFQAPRELVFLAWSDPDHISRWWGPENFTNIVRAWKASHGGAIDLDMRGPNGNVYPMTGTFLEVAKPERLVFTASALDIHGRPMFEVTNSVTFIDKDGGTEMTLVARVGKKTELGAGHLDGMRMGWTQSLERLGDLVGADGREIVVTRIVDAPQDLVWQAMTNPEHVSQWWGPQGFSTTIEKMDVRVGGTWVHIMKGPDGSEFPNKSIFTEVVRPEKIAFEHSGSKKGSEDLKDLHFKSTWTFKALAPERTEVMIRMVFGTKEAREHVVKGYGALEGAKQTLGRLSEHLPTMAAHKDFVISRVFDAPRELVFKVWTQAEHFAAWFGPVGCTCRVAKMELVPGGECLYALMTPNGNELWIKWTFREIKAPGLIVVMTSFADEKGAPLRHPTSPSFPLEKISTVTFEEKDGKTTVTLRWTPFNATEAEQKAFDGDKASATAGWTGTFDRLERYLAVQVG